MLEISCFMFCILLLVLCCILWLLGVGLDLKCEWNLVSSPSTRGGSTWSSGLMPSSIGMFFDGCSYVWMWILLLQLMDGFV